MTIWQALKEVFRSASLYRRQMIFYGLILALIIAGYFFWRNLRPEIAAQSESTLSGSVLRIQLEVLPSGRIQKNGVIITDRIIPRADTDELRYIVVDDSSIYYDVVRVTVVLPEPVNASRAKPPQVIAVHGVGETTAKYLNDRTLYFEARDVFPAATVTIVTELPKGVINVGLKGQFDVFLAGLSGYIWLALAVAIAIFGSIPMIRILYNQNRLHHLLARARFSDQPPEPLSPALVGVLVDGSVGPNTLAATFTDLARRGYIKIFAREDDYAFVQARSLNPLNWQELKSYERDLLSKVFYAGDPISDVEDIKQRLGQHLFSRQVAHFYAHVYFEATKHGFFIGNPSKVHSRYRLIGIGLFYLGILGLIYGILTLEDPKFALFIWAGISILGLGIASLSRRISLRTRYGRDQMAEWLGFAKYLKRPWKATGQDVTEQRYDEFLPYAVVLHAALPWTQHFDSQAFALPVWYDATANITDISEFAKSFLPFVEYLGEQFDFAHEPTVE